MLSALNSNASGAAQESKVDNTGSSGKWKNLNIRNNLSGMSPISKLAQPPPPTQQSSSLKNIPKKNPNAQGKSLFQTDDTVPIAKNNLEIQPADHNNLMKTSKDKGAAILSPEELQKKQRLQEIRKKISLKDKSKGDVGKNQTKKEGCAKLFIKNLAQCWREKKLNLFKRCTSRKKRNSTKDSGKQAKTSATDQGSPQNKNLKNDKSTENFDNGSAILSANASKNNSFSSNGVRDILKQKIKHSMHQQTEAEKENELLHKVLQDMSKEDIFEKAYRHLIDGLLYRNVRHDLDGEGRGLTFVRIIWRLQNSSLWNDLLLLLGWVYILMSFFEPYNRMDASLPAGSFTIMATLEVFILSLQTIDLIFELIQRSTQHNSSLLLVLFQRKKNFFRLLFFLLNFSDLMYYAIKYPINTFRFARPIRPLQIIIFSKQLRRSFQGIINSGKHLLMILVLYIIITMFFAYIGTNMLGDLFNDPNQNTYAVDFRDILKAANVLYIFSSLDLYPDILFPAIQSSYLYLLYFLPYLLMFLFLFAPIPTAVVYDGYRRHRLNLLIADRVKRRKALWACFQCIVSNRKKSYISQEEFIEFFKFVYSKVELEETAEVITDILWEELDDNNNKKASIDEFFNLIDITEQRQDLRIIRIKPLKKWAEFRQYIDEKYHLEMFINGKIFEFTSFLITIGSCVTTIINLFSDNPSSIVDGFDKFFFAFFCLEIILKMIAFGPDGYFNESWNIFDFSLVGFQAFFDYVFYNIMSGSSVKSVGASRVLKIAKLQKVFRMFRALRTAKILNYIFQGLDLIRKVYEMLYKIFICIPIVLKLSIIIVIFFYIYAAIGVEIFAENLVHELGSSAFGQNMCAPGTNAVDYTYCEYANFDSFGGAFLILLQVCVGSGWSYIQFDYSKKFDDMWTSSFFFNSFHFFAVFVLSLIGGLIWEVFDVVERIMRDKQTYDEQLEIQQQWEEQQQQLESSFQSGADSSKKSGASLQLSKMHPRQSIAVTMQMLRMSSVQHKMTMKMGSQMNEFDGKQGDEEEDDEEDEQDDEEGGGEKVQKQIKDNGEAVKSIENMNNENNKNIMLIKSQSKLKQQDSSQKIQSNREDTLISKSKLDASIDSESEEEEDTEESQEESDGNDEEESDEEEQSEECLNYFPTFNQHHDIVERQPQKEKNNPNEVNIFEKDKSELVKEIPLQGKDSNPKPYSDNTMEKVGKQIDVGIRKVQSQQEQVITETQGDQLAGSRICLVQHLSQNQRYLLDQDLENTITGQRKKSKKKSTKGNTLSLKKIKPLSKRNKRTEQRLLEKQMEEQIFLDNDAVTQREKAQIIFFQDKFQMSTLDLFFRNRNITAFVVSGVEIKGQNFEVIKEEEEEDNERHGGASDQKSNVSIMKEAKGKKHLSQDNVDSKRQNARQTSLFFQKHEMEMNENENQFMKKQDSRSVSNENEADNVTEESMKISDLEERPPKRHPSRNQNKADQDVVSILNRQTKQFDSEKRIKEKHVKILSFEKNCCSLKDFHRMARTQSEQAIPKKDVNGNDGTTTKGGISRQLSSQGLGEDLRKQFKEQEQFSTSDRSLAENNIGFAVKDNSSDLTFPVSEYFPSRTLHEKNGKRNIELVQRNASEEDAELSPIFRNQSIKKKSSDYGQINNNSDNNQTINPLETSSKIAGIGNQHDWQSFLQHSQADEPILGGRQQSNFSQALRQQKGSRQFYQEQQDKNDQQDQMFFKSQNHQKDNTQQNQKKIAILSAGKIEGKTISTEGNPLDSVTLRDNAPNITRDNSAFNLITRTDQETSTQIQPILRYEEAPNSECIDDLMNPESSFFQEFKQIEQDLSYKEFVAASQKRKEERAERNLKRRQLREKHREEMEKLFSTTLLDVELQGGSLDKTPQNPLLAMVALQKKIKFGEKSDQRDLIQDLPKNKLLKNHVLNMNQSLRQEQAQAIRVDLTNMNYILNKAILKQINPEKVKNIEMRHFRHLYGSQFEDILEEDVSPLWKEQAMLLFQFDNLFKFSHFPIEQFIQMYCGLEMQLSALVMNKFSSIKIIYQDQEDKWFTINYIQESYFLQEVPKEGPWQFFEQMFEGRINPKRLLKHRNMYSFSDKSDYAKKFLQKSFTVSQNISNNYYFRQLQINQKRSDVVYIPIINENPELIRKNTLDVVSFSQEHLPEYIRKEDLSLEQIPVIKRGLVVAHLFDNPVLKSRKKKFTSDTLNIEQAIIEEDMLSKEQMNATLNYPYSIELLKDLRNHIAFNKAELFTKISQFYFYRYCFEKNFSDIQQVPFE